MNNISYKFKYVIKALFSVFAVLSIAGCSSEGLQLNLGSISTISGKVVPFLPPAGSSKVGAQSTCPTVDVKLFEINDSGYEIYPPLKTVKLDSDGTYTLNGLKELNLSITSNTASKPYLVQAAGCGKIYSRIITKSRDQEITFGTSVVSYAVASTQSSRVKPAVIETKGQKIDELFSLLNFKPDFSTAYSYLQSDPTAQAKFQELFGTNATILPEAAPQAAPEAIPAILEEGLTYNLSANAYHWNSAYDYAYEWYKDGVLLSTSTTFSYTPNANEQKNGAVFTIKVGKDDGGGNVDMSQPYRTIDYIRNISNTIPASVPTTLLASSSNTANPLVYLQMNTGAALANCESFSRIAITENTTTPPTSSLFSSQNITCTTAVTQNIPYNLADTSDGVKTLRIWTQDAQGNVSTTFQTASMTLDSAAPTLSYTSPANGTVANSGLTITGTCDTTFNVDITGAGLSAPISLPCPGGTFSQAITFTAGEGNKTITVSQTDLALNTISDTRTFVNDTIAPSLAYTSPVANTPAQTGLTITGTCEAGITVNISGTGLLSPPTTSCPAGTFSQAINFTAGEGTKNIVVSQTDAAGNTGSANRDFVRDNTAPTLTFSGPAVSTEAQTGVTITGTCETGLTVNISGSGHISPATTTCGAGTFSEAVTFTSGEGFKTIVVSQTDGAGNTGTADRTFIRDNTAPTLTFTSPAVNTEAQTGVTITGTCEAGYTVNISGAGHASPATTACGAGTFSQAITFTAGEGTKNIVVSQTDAAGNTGSANRDFVRDNTAPTLTFTSPAVNTEAQTGVTITGTCEAGYTVNISGTGHASPATTACGAGTFSQAITFTAGEGTKNIVVSQTDAAGNTGSANRDFVRDNTAPTLTFTSPAVNTEAQTGVTITGTCEAGYTVNISGAGHASPATTACGAGTFSQAITFTAGEGTKNIVVSQTDAAGNTGSANRDFVRDNTAPTLTFTSPAVNTEAQTGVTITGTCEAGYTVNISGTGHASPATTACGAGIFSQAITFTAGEGTKNIVVSQTDAAGNTGSANRDFVRDNTAPVLAYTSPAANTRAQTGLTIEGTCETGITVDLSGTGLDSPTATTCTAGTFSQFINFTAGEGTKNIVVSQTDPAGNTGSANRNFIRDNTPPTAPSISIDEGTITTSPTVDLTLAATDAIEMYITNNNTCSAGGSWETYNTAKANWSLSALNQSVSVYVKFRDVALNETACISDSIIHDNTAPSVTLTSLTGGQAIEGGTPVAITWTATDSNMAANPITLEYSSNSGGSWTTIATNETNDGTYTWTPPAVNSPTYRVRITAIDQVSLSSQSASSSNFTIDSQPPTVTLTSLTGGQVIRGGAAAAITWTAFDNNFGANPIDIEYSTNSGGAWTTIATGEANDGTYSWTAPSINSTTVRVRVTATDAVGKVTSASAADFAIDSTAPSLSLTSFDSGGIVPGDTVQAITWTASDNHFGASPITIEISSNSGGTWSALAGPLSNSGSYNWTVSQADGANYRIRITAVDMVSHSTVVSSSTNFEISRDLPDLTQTSLTSPYYSNSATQVTIGGDCETGLNITLSGTESGTIPCPAGTWSHTSNVYGTDATRTFTVSQTNIVGTTNVNFVWTRDTVGPAVNSVLVNSGDTYSGTQFVSVAVNATDTNQSTLQVRLDQSTGAGNCQSEYADDNWLSHETANKTHNFFVSAGDGVKKVCAWAKDSAGNVTTIAPATGTNGVNYDEIIYQVGNMPEVTAFSVSNQSDGSEIYGLGDTVEISWTIGDTEGLDNNPVDIYYTTDNVTWNPVVVAYGGLGGNPTTYTHTYTGFTAPTTGYFRLSITATDAAGNTSLPVLSPSQNTGAWSIYAGSPSNGFGGSALSTKLSENTPRAGSFAINPVNGNVYTITEDGIVKIDITTGRSSLFAIYGTPNLPANGPIPSPLQIGSTETNIQFDSNGKMYLQPDTFSYTTSGNIYQLDLNANTAKHYIGGGTAIDGTATPSTAYVARGAVFRFDESNSLYYLASCTPGSWDSYGSVSTLKMLKVTQNPDGTPGTFSEVAGNCVKGTSGSGVSALATPLTSEPWMRYFNFVVSDNGQKIIHGSSYDSKITKIISGTAYDTNITHLGQANPKGFAFHPSTNKLAFADGSIQIWTINWSGANGDTMDSTYLTHTGAGNDCLEDAIASNQACSKVSGQMQYSSLGQLFFGDGQTVSYEKPFRIRFVDDSSLVRTLAGTLPFYGDGLDKSLIRGAIGGIYYKQSTEPNQLAFPEGLYFVDGDGPTFNYINPSTKITTTLWGSQVSTTAVHATGTTVSKNLSMGVPYYGGSGKSFTIDSNGLPWIRYTHAIATIDQNNQIIKRGNNTYWSYFTPGVDSPYSTGMYPYGAQQNMQVHGNRLFLLGRYYTPAVPTYNSQNPVMRIFDYDGDEIIHVMGDTGTTSSADTANPLDIPALSIDDYCRNANCALQYESATDTLYWTEGAKFRHITTISNLSTSTLVTDFTASGAIANFILSPDRSLVFYTRVSDGKLYCHDLAGGGPAYCNDTILGPTTGMESIVKGPNQMTWVDANTLLISNYRGLIYKVDLTAL